MVQELHDVEKDLVTENVVHDHLGIILALLVALMEAKLAVVQRQI
jgi:hypothetical protein